MRKEGLVELGVGAAWLLGMSALVRVVELLVASNPLVAAGLGAFVVDFGATRAGVRWDGAPGDTGAAKSSTSTRPPKTSWKRWRREIGLGLGLALLVTSFALAVAILAGWAELARGGLVAGLGYGGARAAAIGVRDELLYRGVVLLFAARAGLPRGVGLAYAALAGTAAIALAPGASVAALLTAAAAGLAFGALWLTRRGAIAAVAAHAGWNLFAGAGLHGAVVDAIFARGDLGDGARASGWVTMVAAVAWAVTAIALLRRSNRERLSLA